ncbi:CAP domain-containing protein [Chitinophaga horti]|uniref:CAP domain-containing protein n=1 Tax=Chitinophaga horti TaxID=2920382 RepID=A0ABY6IZG5_9BACT|nr:CAP domain-containing protein [Chitinophaga horti]UYQ92798.1 CAP domain-containing protein [Chitinophaga horti]
MKLFFNGIMPIGIALSLLFVSCAKESTTEIIPANEIAVRDTVFTMNNNVNKAVMLELINEARAKGCNCGGVEMAPVGPVTWNLKLEQAAYLHAKEMRDSSYFSHTGANGSNAGQRITNVGYKWAAYGENLALGILSEQQVMAGWLNSPTHCQVIMNARYKEMGVALVGNFWAQEFAEAK